ncbi:MAG: UxaA family hydrolase [Niabella sp.]
MQGYLRKDGRKGIRNIVVVAYLVECAKYVAQQATFGVDDVHLIGFPGCYPNAYAQEMMHRLCTHPNVGAVCLVSLGCEGMEKKILKQQIEESGREAALFTIQENGGTLSTINAVKEWVAAQKIKLSEMTTVELHAGEFIIGTICGGSDGTSGITANPAVGNAFDRLIDDGNICIFEETGELVGCETHLALRTNNKELSNALIQSVQKARIFYEKLGYPSFAPGNADGGLSTIEEKSLGAYSKSGTKEIMGIIKPAQQPEQPGLYLLDVVPDGDVTFGFPNIVDNAEITELIACGCHIILFTTGRGSVVGSAISPVIKICANPDTYKKLSSDMDINAGKILTDNLNIKDIGLEIYNYVYDVASQKLKSRSEMLGHQEFILTYK